MRVEWTDAARFDVHDIDDRLSARDPRRADALLERLFLRAESLAEFPDLGPVVPEAPESGYRHLMVDGYRLLYKRTVDACYVVGVRMPGEALRLG